MVSFHPDRGNIAVKNSKYTQGTSQWGFQWVSASYPAPSGGYMTYSVTFSSSHVSQSLTICHNSPCFKVQWTPPPNTDALGTSEKGQ